MKKICVCVLLATLAFVSYAQKLNPRLNKCEAFLPDALNSKNVLTQSDVNRLMKTQDYGQSSSKSDKNFWIVYSDRANNTTFSEPGSKQPYDKLDFNEEVRIAQIKDGYALVYTEPMKRILWPQFSDNIEWRGWIPMKRLLLWRTCPVNDKGIYPKAMLCANLDDAELGNGNLGKLFKNPNDLAHYEHLSVNFNYYFIMKKEGKLSLLATENSMDAVSDKILYGWVDENSFVPWDQRSCLEPTWEIAAADYFSKNAIKARIYEDKTMKSQASYVGYEYKKDDGNPDRYRMDGSELRYPILNTEKKITKVMNPRTNELEDVVSVSKWQCSTFNTPTSGKAINAGTTDTKKQDIGDLELLTHINIGIVIDGTKSMEKYYPAVRDAIKEFSKYFSSRDKVKVGVLIYRDKADGDYVTEFRQLTNPANPSLSDFLNTGGKYGIKSSSRDRTMDEALFYGISTALTDFNFNEKESNMMFVVGDCGDAGEYPISESDIIRRLANKNVNLMGFQVRNDSDPSFSKFNMNMCNLIKGGLETRFRSLDSNVKVKAKLTNNSYEFVNNADSEAARLLYSGSHKYLQSGVLSTSILQKQLNDAIIRVKSGIDVQKQTVVIKQSGGTIQEADNGFKGNGVVSGSQLLEAWFRQRVNNDALYESLKKSSTTVSFRGWTPKQDKSGYDYYKTVIFISQQELNSLVMRLTGLFKVAQERSDDRDEYYTAMRALIRSMIPNISDREMDSMSIDEIMSMANGVFVPTGMTSGPTLAEVLNTKAVNAVEYQQILANFKKQYMKLQDIQKIRYKYSCTRNGCKYYWIPTEDLP